MPLSDQHRAYVFQNLNISVKWCKVLMVTLIHGVDRSLLLAAFVLYSCIPWTSSRHHFRHNANGHRSRHRRQGAGLFLPASYVIPGGEGSGAWGEWGEVSPCSRTCGGGVASQKRICLEIGNDGQPLCSGGDTKYFSCQTQDCPEGSLDFRSEQCSSYDDKTFRGNRFNWVPYTKALNPCELNCMPRGERFYYRQQLKVVDGTRCNDESFDVCVDGTCQPVGCDMMLGSNAREDKCRQCRGDGSNCRTVSGIFDSQDLQKGYNDILLIPEGATNIMIAEIKSSNNYLALRAKQDSVYYLNGDYHIDFPRTLMIAGALWHYERSQQGFAAPDKLRCLGPTNETLYLSLLLQDHNVGINYEYSVPSSFAPPPNQQYNWVHEKFSECSATCGGGYQIREVTCRSREDLDVVDNSLCDENLKPATNQSCNTEACAPRWVEGPWSPCSKPCGKGGTQSRQVYCEQIISNGATLRYPSIVGDKECFDLHGPKPELYQECNANASCPTWFTGPWKPCDKLCGDGKQTRQVVCHQKINNRIDVFDDDECQEEKPATEKPCYLHPCDGIDWVITDWSGCDTCLSKVRTRVAVCATKDRKIVDSKLCEYHSKPLLEEPCDRTKLPACEVQWYATQWSNCSVECGKGVQSRRIFCGMFDGASVLKVDDDRCDKSLRYNDTKECEVPKEKCPAKWFAGPWSECSKECGGGEQYRKVMCLSGDKMSNACDQEDILDDLQSCNIGPCNKDEILPLDSKSTPIMDDYEDEECVAEEDEYPEVGAEAIDISFTDADLMFSDSPGFSEGSGTWSTSEIETEFSTTESGSGSEPTDSSVSFDTTFTESEETISTESTITDDTITETTGATDESSPEITETTVTGDTDMSTESTIHDATTESDTALFETSETISTEETNTTEIIETTTGVLSSTDTEMTDKTESTIHDATTESDTALFETSETISTEETNTTEIIETTTGVLSSTDTEMTDKTETVSTEETITTESEPTNETTTSETTEESVTSSSEQVSTDATNTTVSTEEPITSSSEQVSTDVTDTTVSTEQTITSSSEQVSTDATDTTVSTEQTITISSEQVSTDATETTLSTEETTGSETETTVTESTENTSFKDTILTTDFTGSETTEQSTTETGSTESSESTISSSETEATMTEQSSTSEGSTTESGGSTTEAVTEESSFSTDSTTESSTLTDMSTLSSEGSESTTEETGSSTESTETTETGETTELSTTETIESSTMTTEMSETDGTQSTSESSSTTEETGMSESTTPWDWTSTVEIFTTPKRCKPRKKAKCIKSKFGCCPDKRTPAAGPFDEGCPNPKTCKESKFGCCPDGVSPASGPKVSSCPISPCNETLYGCCASDNVTAAEGNDQQGCPPPPPACKSSKYGCCKDNMTASTGPNKKGCPETQTKAPTTTAAVPTGDCASTKYGCCYDNKTDASGPNGEGCPCSISEFGCCPDGLSTAQGANMEGCIMSCNTSAYGCCPDGETPAHGPDYVGCCLQYPFGCCRDNYKPAEGPHLEGCDCQSAHYGCCPDNVTVARGPDNLGCGCQYTQHGCCPDRHTEAKGPDYEGCGCHTYQFGCCPDGITISTGPDLQGCYCQQSKYGCCDDGVTAAKGPNMLGCDCSNSKYGCCPDGTTEAKGPKFLNCTDVPENRQAACALSNDRGPCRNYSVQWFYDVEYGSCSRFWYGGCEGNGNRFASQEECKDVCENPSPKDSCKLPQVKGACSGYFIRWYYDSNREQCSQFAYGGCLGNSNNFDTKQECQERCEPEKTEDQCNLSIDGGSCAGNFLRWGYQPETRRCEQFIWGGCEGNANRFNSEAACMLRCNPPGAPLKECSQPQEAGNCTEKLPVWSFSQTENRCVPFYYTGCGGNDNRFQSEEDCAQSCPSAYVQEMCTLPALTGECAEYTQRWFYDTTKKRCRQFYYGGCGGNENNFKSEAECETRCSEQVVTTTVQPAPQNNGKSEYCFLEMDPGPCTQSEPRWGYDGERGDCVLFKYGGCGGNRNNFPSLEYCQYYCPPEADTCQLPMLAGPCTDSDMRWFYDHASDQCSQFTYGGCEGNANRFESLEECEQRCRGGASRPPASTAAPTTTSTISQEYIPSECIVPAALEECQQAGEVWYLDVAQRACVAHTNGAAGAGARCRHTAAFPSLEGCERACGAFRGLDVCRYTLDPGPCTDSIPKVYFNPASGECESFAYGGCHGGPNRFSSVTECEQVCKPNTDPCKQPLEPGNCLEYYVKWYYDVERDSCQQFVYSGCNGNENRFETREECEGRCRAVTTTPYSPPVVTTPVIPSIGLRQGEDDECSTPESLEPCGQNVTIYYWDARTEACLAGEFGACGRRNTYRSEEACQRRCGAFAGLDVCKARLDAGPCLYSIPKIYWDARSGRCLSFAYGGCHGGPNRFSTVEECEEVCGSSGPDAACLAPVSVGTVCGIPSRRWHYSGSDGDCRAFVYLGCDGTDNNFRSYDECAQTCRIPDSGEDTNEVLPDCDAYNEECATLRCEYGVQHTRTAGGCERCSCVFPETDCGSLQAKCDSLKCTYGRNVTRGPDGCDRCRCIDHPCSTKQCQEGERCAVTSYRDPISQEGRYSAECRLVNKTGSCPADDGSSASSGCRSECDDDADCLGVGRCCPRGCSRLCLAPAAAPSTAAPATTHEPGMLVGPHANVETEPEVVAHEGGTATLRCLFHGNPPPKITWRRGEITIDDDVGRYRLLSDGALEIVSLYRNDSGVYICVADNGLGIATQEIRLEVDDPVDGPAGISGSPNSVYTGELGQSLNVRCLAYGYPPPAIYWYRGRNGAMVPYSSTTYEARGNILQIRRLSLETLGEYVCQAYNGVGKPADWSFVVQAYRPEGSGDHPYLVSREADVIVTPREPQTDPTTTPPPIIEVPIYTAPVKTRIASENGRVQAGAEINLPCDVDGYPVPDVYWTKDNVRIVPNDRIQATEARLTVSRASSEDSGVYGCHAANAYSSHFSTLQVTVEGLYIPPTCKDNPYFANCHLIVQSKFCHHKYYSSFCCKSCVESGQLDPAETEMQADTPWYKRK